jgi:hypothetical protein
MLVRKGDSIYLCRDSRWRKIYPALKGPDIPCLAGTKPSYITWPRTGQISSGFIGSNFIFFVPIVIQYAALISGIAINIAQASSTGIAYLGIYDSERRTVSNSDYYYPNNLLRSGSIGVNSIGIKTVTFSSALELQSGELYFLSFLADDVANLSISRTMSFNPIEGQFFCDYAISYANHTITLAGYSTLPNPAPSTGYFASNTTPIFSLMLSDIFLP